MAVNWNWKDLKGQIIWKGDFNNKKYKVSLYSANCLGALIYNFKDKETNEKMYTFIGFWDDEKHLKRCLGLVKNYDKELRNIYKDNIIKIKLDVNYKDNLKIAKLFAEAGHKVELYKGKEKGGK